MGCKNLDNEETQILVAQKNPGGNNNQEGCDEFDKYSSQKPAWSGGSPGRLCGSLIILLEENSTRLVSVKEKRPILSARKFLHFIIRSIYEVPDLP